MSSKTHLHPGWREQISLYTVEKMLSTFQLLCCKSSHENTVKSKLNPYCNSILYPTTPFAFLYGLFCKARWSCVLVRTVTKKNRGELMGKWQDTKIVFLMAFFRKVSHHFFMIWASRKVSFILHGIEHAREICKREKLLLGIQSFVSLWLLVKTLIHTTPVHVELYRRLGYPAKTQLLPHSPAIYKHSS